jgi:hypothetical protein
MVIEKEEPADRWHGGGLRDADGLSGEMYNDCKVSELKPRTQDPATKKWLLHRFRTAHSGMTLVQRTIEDIGKDLGADRISNEQAAYDLNAIEETPLLYLSSLLTPEYGEVA